MIANRPSPEHETARLVTNPLVVRWPVSTAVP